MTVLHIYIFFYYILAYIHHDGEISLENRRIHLYQLEVTNTKQ